MISDVSVLSVLGVVGEETLSLSTPLKVLCSDQKVYVLKPDVINHQERRVPLDSVMLNEAIGSYILSLLNLSTPCFAKLTLDSSFFEYNSGIIGSNIATMYRENHPYFVTEYIEGDDGMLHKTFKKYINDGKFPKVLSMISRKISSATNKHELALLILADIFMLNTDRFSNVGNFVFSNDNKINWIDHGYVMLLPVWRNKTHLFINSDINAVTNEYYDSLFNRRTPFLIKILDEHADWEDNAIVELIKQLSDINLFTFRNFLNSLPSEWYINEAEQKKVITMMFQDQVERTLAILKKLIDVEFLSNLQTQGGIASCTFQEDTGTQ